MLLLLLLRQLPPMVLDVLRLLLPLLRDDLADPRIVQVLVLCGDLSVVGLTVEHEACKDEYRSVS
jgi:hypothetical protein